MQYSQERKQAVLAKLVPPHQRTVKDVAAEEGISPATLYHWRQQAGVNREVRSLKRELQRKEIEELLYVEGALVEASALPKSRRTTSPLKSNRLNLKPLSRLFGCLLGLAVAATGLAPVAAARPALAPNERGDLALVPYYTVLDEWVTGLHIVNTSARTQVVKLRFRRATDAMDALDFNLVLSPHDVYAGFLSRDARGAIAWFSPDTSCTVPATQGRRLQMPDLYRAGAESGYVEIIAMGAPEDERQPIALAAKHARPASLPASAGSSSTSTSVARPLDCAAVRSNFFADGAGTATGTTTRPGVENHATTWQATSMAAAIKAGGRNRYVDSGDVLKVSYFIRDNATGVEFGDNAVHLGGFLTAPALTNQQYGVLSGDLNGFDFPDLNGGVPRSSAGGASIRRAGFDALRARGALGATAVLNEWSANPANGVELDWVLTLPGQYTMLRLPQYAASLSGAGRPWTPTLGAAGKPVANPRCPRVSTPDPATGAAPTDCDFRDLPVKLAFTAYNREEFQGEAAAGELVVSPAPPSTTATTYLPKVANVITFGERLASGRGGVLGLSDVHIDADLGQPYGWVSARVTSADRDVRVCDWNFANDASSGFGAAAGESLTGSMVCSALTGGVPVIGFTAWSRRVAANPEASYGRIVEHSYGRVHTVPGTVFRDMLKDGGEGPEMVVLPTGSFSMGSPSTEADRASDEDPVRTVTISRRIAMGRYEVTFADYDRFVSAVTGTRRPDDGDWGRGTRPVSDVSQTEAKAYAAWLSAQTGRTYRLPSEAEWEYAARAGTRTRHSWGDAIGVNRANCRGCGSGLGNQPAPVGSFAANGFGLFDMHGNVWELVEDCYANTYTGAPSDGSARTTGCGSDIAVRGGSWFFTLPGDLRSANRFGFSPSFRCADCGFRLVQDLNP